jgi:NADH-quinone oxidoreductase subunit A
MTAVIAIVLDALVVLALVLALSNAGKLLGPKPVHEGDADLPYETGMRPIEPALDRMSVLYVKFAVLFVVFDVDLAFLLPWAFGRAALSMEQLVSMSIFVAFVGLMLAYFWRKGVLECK